ncbi:MAG: hypothetical protein WD757_00280 [Actinomycetota bacterium]
MKDDEAGMPAAGSERGGQFTRLLLRVALTVGALALTQVAASAERSWERIAARTFDYGWVGWIPWLILFALSGALFGLAIWLPRRASYHLRPSVLLGVLPLLLIAYPIAWLNGITLPFLDEPPLHDQLELLGFLVGLSIASGFMEPRTAS